MVPFHTNRHRTDGWLPEAGGRKGREVTALREARAPFGVMDMFWNWGAATSAHSVNVINAMELDT